MPAAQMLAKAFARNLWIIEAQTAGLSHEEALIQVPHVNCLNWVLGHIAEGRDGLLELLGRPPLLAAGERARYSRESEPVRGEGPGVLSLERLLGILREGQERITAALEGLSEAALEEVKPLGDRNPTLRERLHFLHFHDTYHTGQTEILRALAGRTDRVI